MNSLQIANDVSTIPTLGHHTPLSYSKSDVSLRREALILSSLQNIALLAHQYLSTPSGIMTSLPSPVPAAREFERGN